MTQLTDTVVAFLNSAEFAARIPVVGLAGLLGGRTIEAFMDAPPGDRLVACLGRADVVAAIVAKGNQLRDLRRFCLRRPLGASACLAVAVVLQVVSVSPSSSPSPLPHPPMHSSLLSCCQWCRVLAAP